MCFFEFTTVHVCFHKDEKVVFCNLGYPKKALTEDGQRLARHIRNRGRPTDSTIKKVKNSNDDIKAEGTCYNRTFIEHCELLKQSLIWTLSRYENEFPNYFIWLFICVESGGQPLMLKKIFFEKMNS